MVRVGISGFGRISRVVMRAAMDMADVTLIDKIRGCMLDRI